MGESSLSLSKTKLTIKHSVTTPCYCCRIAGVGSYLPSKVITNMDLEQKVNTSDEWITERTGIKERRIASENEPTSQLAYKASLKALEQAHVAPEQVDLIIVATVTPDMIFPSTACILQSKLGAWRAAAFDIEAACSGFLYALEIGGQFIRTGTYETVLVVGAEKLSTIVDWDDRNTCVLFGDGAGAVVLKREGEGCLWHVYLGADGRKADLLKVPAGGSLLPVSEFTLKNKLHYIRMDGRETFKHAVQAMSSAALKVLEQAGKKISDVKCIIPHQANRRIIDAVAERIGAKPEQVFINLDRYGNTSAASVAIALDEAIRTERIKKGDLVLLVAFGAGFTWAAALIEY